jgi:fatty acid desaturase
MDVLAIVYNLWDLWAHFGIGWWIKRWIPAAWFLMVDYFNHYRSSDVVVKRVDYDWNVQQLASTQNFVFSPWLYKNLPFVHSLLTFGLDRQVEHHLFPKLLVWQLSKATPLVGHHKIHYFGMNSLRIMWNEFV